MESDGSVFQGSVIVFEGDSVRKRLEAIELLTFSLDTNLS